MIHMMFIFKFFLKAKHFPIPKDWTKSLFLVKRQTFFAKWNENLYPMIVKCERAKIV